MHLCRSSSNVPCLPSFLEMLQNPHVLVTFDALHNPLRLPRETTSEPPKLVRTWCALYILTWKCASRHNGVHFLDISASKSGPTMVCFVHFDLEMCFAPQRRALVQHLNFQKWSERGVLCTFWLLNVLRATAACTFSTSQLPKVVRPWCALYILTWKCASRHNGVQFFISHLASWLRTRRFSEPTFRPSGATNHWKNTLFRDFPTFSRACIFFLLTLSLLLFSLLIFLFSLTLSISAFHLSKLPSIKVYPYWAAFIWLSWQPDLRISSLSCLPQDWAIFGVGRRANPAAFTAVFVIFCVIGTIIRKCKVSKPHAHDTLKRWPQGHYYTTAWRRYKALSFSHALKEETGHCFASSG